MRTFNPIPGQSVSFTITLLVRLLTVTHGGTMSDENYFSNITVVS